ncbi:hypothetical protein [Flavobacterium branchiicola]|uniref:Lipoprotein n=1 Tax=Flavobacterium branchiicola TaxID=1114875 RepID=A0ABV9P9J8_9FLAO|nr:hypothetical protein [Flavobacterium branchiicola]MBS7252932.1 hypothetical protein [Flavobacterium branchiicola]
MKEILLVIFFVFFISCGNKKNIMTVEKKCKAVPVSSEEVQRQYLHFISDSDFSKKEFEDFNKIKKGVLLYHWTEGLGSNQFLIVDFDKDFNFFYKSKSLTKKVDFDLEDKKKLSFILESLEKGSYYQSCERVNGHSNLYVLIIKCNNEVKVQYFSPYTNLYEIEPSDVNMNSIREVFGMIESNYYKSISLNKK